MSIVAETERLVLREFSPAEAEALFALNADPEVVRYTGDRAFVDVEEARQLLAGYDAYQRHGYGRWSIYLKETGGYIGFCGLAYRPETDEVDLGFRFYRRCWGKGYATEAGARSLELGFEQSGMQQIVGRSMEANRASQRVLAKLGMTLVSSFEREGQTWLQHEITVERFHAGRKSTL